jgi:hypothetical protein
MGESGEALDRHLHRQRVAAAEVDSARRYDVAVVAAHGHTNVLAPRHLVVGRIKSHPSAPGHQEFDPRVGRGLSANS